MSNSGQLVRGTAINAAAAVVSTVLNLVITAVLAKNLSKDLFGTWAFMMILTFGQGYFALLDGGMSVSALRNIVRYRHNGDELAAARVIATLRSHYLKASMGGALVLLLTGSVILRLANVHFSGATQTLVLVGLGIRLIADSLHSANMVLLESQSSFGKMRLLELSSLSLWVGLALLVLLNHGDLKSLTLVYALNGLVLLCSSTLVVRKIEPQPLMYFRWSRADASDLWSTGRWIALQKIWSVLYAQMDRTILGIVLGVRLVGDYEIPYKFQAMGVLILSVFSSAIFPAVAKLNIDSDKEQLTRIFHNATRWTAGLAIPVMLTGMMTSEALIRIWVGESFAHLSGSVSLFLSWPIIASFHVVGASIMSGLGRTKELFILASISIGVNLVLSASLATSMGINGVILGTVVGYAVVFVPYLRFELRLFGAGLRSWFRFVMLPVIPPVIVQVPLLLGVHAMWADSHRPIFLIFCSGICTLIAWAIFLLREPGIRSGRNIRQELFLG